MARPASSSSADSGFVAILAVVFLPAVYIFGAIIALTQFNAMHTLLLQVRCSEYSTVPSRAAQQLSKCATCAALRWGVCVEYLQGAAKIRSVPALASVAPCE